MVCEADRSTLESPEHPIVVLRAAGRAACATARPEIGRSASCCRTRRCITCCSRRPYRVLVMTSGNLSEEPIVVGNTRLASAWRGGRRVPDAQSRHLHARRTIRWCGRSKARPRVLRRSRGYVPRTIDVGRGVPELLACGGDLKNAFCLTKGSHAILSQHIGDLENYETLRFFEETLANLKKLFRVDAARRRARPAPAVSEHEVRAGVSRASSRSRCSITTRTSRAAWRRTGSTAT